MAGNRGRVWLLAGHVCLALGLEAQPAIEEQFETRVRPVLAQCLACHGELKAGGLRLDSREGLLAGGQSGPAVTPGSPESSLLIRAVRYDSDRVRMPPQGRLPEATIAALEEWVRQGAYWPGADKGRGKQAKLWSLEPLRGLDPAASIDTLTGRRLAELGLRRNPPADRRSLLRRVSVDLTGLPPSYQEVEAFLADRSPDAWTRIVDRLLASPHFGERWGRYWLDVARFGEDDYTGTEPRFYPNAWRYRDWVIDALNRDLPYDRFVRQQLAGDLLPEGEDGDPARRLGGLGFLGLGPWYYSIAQPPQARADERHDRIDVVTRGFLGLTVACARCHDHKYDPITMSDYYALGGVFASTAYREFPLAPADQVARVKAHQARGKELERELKEFRDQQSRQLASILSRHATAYLMAAAELPADAGEEPLRAAAAREGLDEPTLARWAAYLGRKELDHPYLDAWRDARGRGASAEELRPLAEAFTALASEVAREKKAIDEENAAIVARLKPPKFEGRKNLLPFDYVSEEDFNPGAEIKTRSLDRDRYVLWTDLFEPGRGILWHGGENVDRFLSGVWKEHAATLAAQVEEWKRQAPEPYPYLHAAAEHPQPADLEINRRGNPTDLGPAVPRGFPAVLSKSEPERFGPGSGRLELAEAILAHPLAARVIANRVWLHLFGEGIVRTPSNFGVTGDTPANPELLDYLAGRLIAGGWRLKPLIREIVLSETYRASSAAEPAATAKDPGNRYFWRANRRRLDAEALRDAILAVSGRLDRSIGGPSVPLDESNFRRTVYARVGRFRQNETLALFDFPSASVTSERRAATNVPLQRLYFLNSRFVHEQACELASSGVLLEDRARIRDLYRRVLARDPSERERELGLAFLAAAEHEPWQKYAQVLLTSNEFLFID